MPALAPVVDKLEDVAEPLRQYYVPKDSKFHLDLSTPPNGYGFVPAADLALANGRVVEFRDNNVKLLQEIEPLRKLKTDVGDLDLAVAKTAVTELKTLKDKGVSKPDDIATLISTAVEAAVKPLKETITSTTEQAKKDRERADDATFRSVIGEKFVKAGGTAKALDFIVGKAKDIGFKVDNGVIVSPANQFSKTNPSSPLTPDEWLVDASKDYDFAFKPSQGGGAPPAGGGGGGPHRAGQTVLRNPTPQQLGDNAKAISAGTVRVEYDERAPAAR